MKQPVLRHIAAFWSGIHYPSKENEWSLDQKFADMKAAGFDGFAWGPSPDWPKYCKKHGLIFLGALSCGKVADFHPQLAACKKAGARVVNVQLADEDTLTPEATGLAILLMQEAKKLGVEVGVEIHRDTCTETPEKAYALAEAYQKVTGELLPMTFDYSHVSLVKHLHPGNYIEKLLVRPDLIQRAQQFHFRPFNGHHCQVPVTDGKGNLTQEVKDCLPFFEAVLKCWLDGNKNTSREIFVIPEMGPAGVYNFTTLPNSWEDAKVLRVEFDKIWKKLTKKRK